MKLSELKTQLTESLIDPQADAKLEFEKDVVGQLSSLIAQAIQMGVVDPTINSSAPATAAPATAAPATAAPAAAAPAATPATATPATATPATTAPAGETPEQKRIRLQKASQQNIDKTATPVGKASSPIPPTPEQIRKQKQAAATQAARAGMTNKPPVKPAVWRSGRNPNGPATTRESKRIARLNSLFESIININEANGKMSISDFIQSKIVPITKSNIFTTSPYKEEVQRIADAIQSSYNQDKGKTGIQALADYTWNSLTSRRKPTNRTGLAPTTAAPSSSAAPNSPAAPATVSPEAEAASKIGVRQINKIIPTLRKRDLLSVKKKVDNTLAGKGVSSTVSPISPPVTAPTPKPAAPDNTVRMPKGKVRAAREGGVTPEEQAKFDEKVRQAIAAQSK